MIRSSLWIFTMTLVGLLSAQISSQADTTGSALAKSVVLESNVEYLQVSQIGKDLGDEIRAAQDTLSVSNTIAGIILDLRFAGGDDFDSAKAIADMFVSGKLPLAILVNGRTRGASAALAADLREKRAGLVFGSAPGPDASAGGKIPLLQPDVSVPVDEDDERSFQQNPFGSAPQMDAHPVVAGKSDFLPFVDHTTEADLVRAKIKDGDQDENSGPQFAPKQPSAPQPQVIRDPVMARAVDLIKGLAVVRASHS
jgi:hypothetical protein